MPATPASRAALQPIQQATFALDGEIGRRLGAVTQQWILPAPFANPGMLEMFRNRNRKPFQDQMPWAGEFAGKYLTHATQIYRLTRDAQLGQHINWFVGELVALQAPSGYLGPWPTEQEMKPAPVGTRNIWDSWGHYHIMFGCLLWYLDQKDERALNCAKRIADYLCDRFLDNPKRRLHDTQEHDKNLAPIHTLVMLYDLTGTKRYMALAKQILKEFEIPPAGDYLRQALAGKEFFETPKPRWESLHPIMGLSELYLTTGDANSRKAFEHLWWSMVKGDRHNNGGFTSGERATGDPYHNEPIETCCTIAWMAMSVEMLRITGNSVVADEIELSLLNSGLGMMSPSGRWVTYNTPMNGSKEASAHSIVFQCKPGTPELNCCSVNGPRALGMICEWAVMARADGLTLNYFGPGRMTAPLSSGNKVTLTQMTDYPKDSRIDLRVTPERAEKFTLAVRIPYWSKNTVVHVNEKAVKGVKAGQHLLLERTWSSGDRVTIELDFTPHFWTWREMTTANDWEATWQVFGPLPRVEAERGTMPPAQSVEAVAQAMLASGNGGKSLKYQGKTFDAKKLVSKQGVLTVGTDGEIDGKHSLMAGVTEIRVARDMDASMYVSADWWCAIYVNGKRVFNNANRIEGNGGEFNFRRNWVNLPLKKGVNRVAFINGGGQSQGPWISMGVSDDVMPGRKQPAYRHYESSIYRGPILLTFDPRYNAFDSVHDITLDAASLKLTPTRSGTWLEPMMLFEARDVSGQPVHLCDFASAGNAGNAYHTWMRLRLAGRVANEFTRENPLRSLRV